MGEIKKILVPVDFSATAQKAFRFALRLGSQLEAELHLLHAIYPQMENIDEPMMPYEGATLAKKQVAEKKLEEFKDLGKTNWTNKVEVLPNIFFHVEVGGAIGVIKAQVKAGAFDLIVMGTHGIHESADNLLGTVASDVVGNASCPVIVVPDDIKENSITKIAHAIEPQWVKCEDVERVIKVFLPIHQEVHLVRFSKQKDMVEPSELTKFKKDLEGDFDEISVKIHQFGKHQLSEDLNDFAEKENIDLLVMYRSKNSFVQKLFHRSRSREMAKKTRIPLLVI